MEQVKESLQCKLCNYVISDPVVLPCGCTGCSGCLHDKLAGKGITRTECPLCRMPVHQKDLVRVPVLAKLAQLVQTHTWTAAKDDTALSSRMETMKEPHEISQHQNHCTTAAPTQTPAQAQPSDDGGEGGGQRSELAVTQLQSMLDEIDALVERTKKRKMLCSFSVKQLKDVYAGAYGTWPKRSVSTREALLSALCDLDGDALSSLVCAMKAPTEVSTVNDDYRNNGTCGSDCISEQCAHADNALQGRLDCSREPLAERATKQEQADHGNKQHDCETKNEAIKRPLAERLEARGCDVDCMLTESSERCAKYGRSTENSMSDNPNSKVPRTSATAMENLYDPQKAQTTESAKRATQQPVCVMFSTTAFDSDDKEAQLKQKLRMMGATVDETDFALNKRETKVTHFITGAVTTSEGFAGVLSHRTRRYFAAVLRNVACVTINWVRDSIAKNEWLDTRRYEVLDRPTQPADAQPVDTQQRRRARFNKAENGLKVEPLLHDCALVPVGSWTKQERDLAVVAGAQIYSSNDKNACGLHSSKHFSHVVCLDKNEDAGSKNMHRARSVAQRLMVPVLGVSWLLDCITYQQMLGTEEEEYIIARPAQH